MTLPKANPSLVSEFTDRIGLSAPIGRNNRGETGFELPTYYPARIEYQTRETRLNTGEIRMEHSHTYILAVAYDADNNLVYLDDLPAVTPEWQITFPDGSNPIILRVDRNNYGDMTHLQIYT